jgi:hypothetical protein
MSMKNSSNTMGNRTRDLPVCSAVPQPLRHHVPRKQKELFKKMQKVTVGHFVVRKLEIPHILPTPIFQRPNWKKKSEKITLVSTVIRTVIQSTSTWLQLGHLASHANFVTSLNYLPVLIFSACLFIEFLIKCCTRKTPS